MEILEHPGVWFHIGVRLIDTASGHSSQSPVVAASCSPLEGDSAPCAHLTLAGHCPAIFFAWLTPAGPGRTKNPT